MAAKRWRLLLLLISCLTLSSRQLTHAEGADEGLTSVSSPVAITEHLRRPIFSSGVTSAAPAEPPVEAAQSEEGPRVGLPVASTAAVKSQPPLVDASAAAVLSSPVETSEPTPQSVLAPAPEMADVSISISVPSPSLDSLEGRPAVCHVSDLPEFRCMMPLGPQNTFLYFSPPSATWLHMGLLTTASGWVALGWSVDGQMVGGEVVIGNLQDGRNSVENDNASKVYELTGMSVQSVVPASTNTFTVAADGTGYSRAKVGDGLEQVAEKALLQCNRSISGGKVRIDSAVFVIWAYSEGSMLAYHGREARGSVGMDMAQIDFDNPESLPEGVSAPFLGGDQNVYTSAPLSASPPSSPNSEGRRLTLPPSLLLAFTLCAIPFCLL